MILPDTSIWIEFLKGSAEISSQFETLLEQRSILAQECIFAELLQGVKNKREKEGILDFWYNLPQVSQENLWLDAGILSNEKKIYSKGVGLIDLVIILAARRHGAKIWSLDKKLNGILAPSEIYSGD